MDGVLAARVCALAVGAGGSRGVRVGRGGARAVDGGRRVDVDDGGADGTTARAAVARLAGRGSVVRVVATAVAAEAGPAVGGAAAVGGAL